MIHTCRTGNPFKSNQPPQQLQRSLDNNTLDINALDLIDRPDLRLDLRLLQQGYWLNKDVAQQRNMTIVPFHEKPKIFRRTTDVKLESEITVTDLPNIKMRHSAKHQADENQSLSVDDYRKKLTDVPASLHERWKLDETPDVEVSSRSLVGDERDMAAGGSPQSSPASVVNSVTGESPPTVLAMRSSDESVRSKESRSDQKFDNNDQHQHNHQSFVIQSSPEHTMPAGSYTRA